jgi:hypothetical protein
MEIKTMETKVKEEKVMEMENINFIFHSFKRETQLRFFFFCSPNLTRIQQNHLGIVVIHDAPQLADHHVYKYKAIENRLNHLLEHPTVSS